MRVITNNGYYQTMTLYICTVVDITGLAKLIQNNCCIQNQIVILFKYSIKLTT